MDSTTISAIIIDDEPDAINLLEMYLRQFVFVKVTGTETSALKGLELVKGTLPELVFLDIDMPDMNGLRVAEKIQSENAHTEIVFTTAHQHYAYDALGIEPLDFLTKPFCKADLELVMQKYKAKSEKKTRKKKLEKFIYSQANSPKIKLPSTQGIIIVEIKNIVFLKSKANNCSLHLQDGTTETITRNLYVVVELINSQSMLQINRATYININYIKRVDKKNRKCTIEVNGTVDELIITKPYMNYFEKVNSYPTI